MVLPALRALPRAEQRWMGVTHPRALPMYEAAGLFDTLVEARGASAPVALHRVIRRFRPERALVFTEAWSGAALSRLSGAPRRLGWGRPARGFSETVPAPDRVEPLWRSYVRLAAAAGGTPTERPDFALVPGRAAQERAASWLAGAGGSWIALAPGASYGPSKQWPMGRFVGLSEALQKQGRRVVVLGGKGETALGATLAAGGATDLTGRTTLLEAIAVLAACRAAVTNDSGSMHLARAAGTPVVGLFGSSSPRWTGPEPGEGAALWLGLECSPCFRRACPLAGPAHLRCLRDIAVTQVLEAVEGVVS